ncbi:MAG: hypothetical protein PQJ61_02295 [Spirochaetales bacterium]|uniref:Uncharacterized protein n=1 Tax=Candidatus Thalassospirochaeta sargassi TaxID=3119039 RepID=A0AAJ1MLB1_9SPIO|nr:hypothetical protein [Spirochaetales bacterium]
MSEGKITIFHIYRKDGSSIFLYPFTPKQNLIDILDSNEIAGVYGREPRVESLTMLRNELYRLIEQSVRDWSSEKKFIPRFLLSTAVFLLLYFIMSVVIRDPIPMIDEIIVGFAGAVASYIILAKRDSDSKTATAMKVRLRTKVDEIVFNEDNFTKDVEQYLQVCETSTDMEHLLRNMTKDESGIMFDYSDRQKVNELMDSIRMMFDDSDIKKHEKMFRKLTLGDDSAVGKTRMLKWMSSRKVDPFLFAVYTKIIQRD